MVVLVEELWLGKPALAHCDGRSVMSVTGDATK